MTESGPLQLPSSESVLRDGRRVLLRPIRDDDRERWLDFFYRLSPRARFLRFHFAKSHPTPHEIDYFTQVRPPSRCAYVATVGQGEGEKIIALGRFDQAEPADAAEVAFTVDDSIQSQGIGTALLEQLASVAPDLGYRTFIASVLPENTRMQDVFEHCGLKVSRRFEDGLYLYSIDLTEIDEHAKRRSGREHVARSAGVRHLLYPKSVVVVGASRDPRSVGGGLFRNLLSGGFQGIVFPVNHAAPAVAGVKAYPSILEVPGEVDLAVIAVPAESVETVVGQCAEKGVWGLVVISAGFGEAGGDGRKREDALRERTLAYSMRVIGPNCLGIVNTDSEVGMNATFAPVQPIPGRISMSSQSGALGIALLDYATSIGLGLAQFVSIGNRIDVSPNDLLEFWEDDAGTDVILLYLESFGNPRRFSRIARRVSRSKPIVSLKSGRSASGARAASSHTGALAGADAAADALFRQAGVIRVDTVEDMFAVAQVLAYQPPPKGDRVAILTNAGGPGILAADACEALELSVPQLSEQTQSRLQAFLPPQASVANPVDMIASAPPDHYRQALSVLLDDPEVDAVVLIYIPPLVTDPDDIAAAVRDAYRAGDVGKPVIACFMMSRGAPPELALGKGKHIPSFTFPEDAVRALALARRYARFRESPEGQVVKFTDANAAIASEAVASALKRGAGWMQPEEALSFLSAYGIRTAPAEVARSAEEAVSAAQHVGFPVAVKLRSHTLVHKTDLGGVHLGLGTPQDVEDAYRQIMGAVESAQVLDQAEGVIVQSMAPSGQEAIVGMSLDPNFGPLVMAGLGGVAVEALRDVSFSLHPLTDLDAGRMLHELRSASMLGVWRGRPARDIAALQDMILRFSALIDDWPEVEEIEVNPVIILAEGEGCVAVDARVRVGARGPYSRRSRSSSSS